MHMNIGMHDNELRMAHEDADNELHERQALHRRLGDLEVKCAKLEQETFEMEAIVEKQGWDDERALGDDMKAEREREEEIKRAEREVYELLSERRYRERILKAENVKLLKAQDKVAGWCKEVHNAGLADGDYERTRAKAQHDIQGEGFRRHRHASTAGVVDRGGKASRMPFGAPPPRRQTSAGTLHYKSAAEYKNSGKTPR